MTPGEWSRVLVAGRNRIAAYRDGGLYEDGQAMPAADVIEFALQGMADEAAEIDRERQEPPGRIPGPC